MRPDRCMVLPECLPAFDARTFFLQCLGLQWTNLRRRNNDALIIRCVAWIVAEPFHLLITGIILAHVICHHPEWKDTRHNTFAIIRNGTIRETQYICYHPEWQDTSHNTFATIRNVTIRETFATIRNGRIQDTIHLPPSGMADNKTQHIR
jgi:hypothetical protein